MNSDDTAGTKTTLRNYAKIISSQNPLCLALAPALAEEPGAAVAALRTTVDVRLTSET